MSALLAEFEVSEEKSLLDSNLTRLELSAHVATDKYVVDV